MSPIHEWNLTGTTADRSGCRDGTDLSATAPGAAAPDSGAPQLFHRWNAQIALNTLLWNIAPWVDSGISHLGWYAFWSATARACSDGSSENGKGCSSWLSASLPLSNRGFLNGHRNSWLFRRRQRSGWARMPTCSNSGRRGGAPAHGAASQARRDLQAPSVTFLPAWAAEGKAVKSGELPSSRRT